MIFTIQYHVMNITLAIILIITILSIFHFFNQRQYVFDRRKKKSRPTLDNYDLMEESELNEMASFNGQGYSMSSMRDRRQN